jgi:hypothetical protein
MVHFTKPNCIYCDNLCDCKHPEHSRKFWLTRLLFGPRTQCVLETARYYTPRDGEVTCFDQKKYRPNNPPSRP